MFIVCVSVAELHIQTTGQQNSIQKQRTGLTKKAVSSSSCCRQEGTGRAGLTGGVWISKSVMCSHVLSSGVSGCGLFLSHIDFS